MSELLPVLRVTLVKIVEREGVKSLGTTLPCSIGQGQHGRGPGIDTLRVNGTALPQT